MKKKQNPLLSVVLLRELLKMKVNRLNHRHLHPQNRIILKNRIKMLLKAQKTIKTP
nr:MAG TPA: hypothetical protein [Caudoviricetes sp.]